MQNTTEPAASGTDLRLLTKDELAEVLGVPASWVRAKAAAHEIPHRRIGRHIRFAPEDVAAILAASKQTPIDRRKAV